MQTVTSRDGTTIAFDKQGDGPALILIDGQQLTEALAANHRGDAVALFMRLVGPPSEQVEAMRSGTARSGGQTHNVDPAALAPVLSERGPT